ncbi:MAG: type 2 lanthipeptide synthetase LanM family protein, partial [Thermoanaerobaculia bacterium]
ITTAARLQLDREILRRIADAGALVALDCFDRFRSAHAADAYRTFVARTLADGYRDLFTDYSALGRRLIGLVDGWTASVAEMLARLTADEEPLEKTFAIAAGEIASIESSLSDRHDGGRTVTRLTFASGGELIYKPRDVGIVTAWNDLLRWLASHGLSDAPAPLTVVEREGYGWVEHVPQTPAKDHSAAERYFARAGSLVFLAWLLEGRDLHMENVIAGPAGPVLVDVEALFHPASALDALTSSTAVAVAGNRIRSSVLNSGLLSFPQADPEGRIYDVGGLRGRGGYVLSHESLVWREVNRDSMRIEREETVAPPAKNVLYLHGEALSPDEFAGALTGGFASTWRLFLEHRDEILASGGPLARFAGKKVRVVFRPSNQYAIALRQMTAPSQQRRGIISGFLIDSLNRIFAGETERPLLWPLVAEERRALERLDIPLFLVPTDSDEIEIADGERLSGWSLRNGFEIVRERIASLDESGLAMQLSLLRASLLPHRDPVEQEPAESGPSFEIGSPIAAREDFLREAAAIGDEILSHAIHGDDGSVTWIAPEFLRLEERPDFGATYYLYGGVTGISIFLAALARVTRTDRFGAAALAALRPLRSLVGSSDAERLLRQEGIGGCNGIGSLVYAVNLTGELLDDPETTALAVDLARFIDEPRIASDERFDVEGGAAGAILALLALHRSTGEPWLLERARLCARHLLDRSLVEGGLRRWPGPDGFSLAGLAHGSAGYTLALARLGAAIGDTALIEAATESLRWEDSVFDPSSGNWPVFRRAGKPPVFMIAWCHGAAGIGLSRLSLRGLIKDDAVERGIERSTSTVLADSLFVVDHLCCGNLGRDELLVESGGEALEEARRRATVALDRRRNSGAWALQPDAEENRIFQPGFFRGLAGIGYSMLRLANPESLPSVLSFGNAAFLSRRRS